MHDSSRTVEGRLERQDTRALSQRMLLRRRTNPLLRFFVRRPVLAASVAIAAATTAVVALLVAVAEPGTGAAGAAMCVRAADDDGPVRSGALIGAFVVLVLGTLPLALAIWLASLSASLL